MTKYFIFVIILNLAFSSCEKEEDHKPVTAGEYDTDFIFHEFSAPLSIVLIYDSLTNYYNGADSIDLNLDGNFDLKIDQQLQIPHLTDDPTNQLYPYCRLIPSNGLELAVNIQKYPGGLGSYRTVEWIESLNFQDRIDTISNWSEPNTFRYMWCYPLDSFVYTYGNWYEITNSETYIGFRMKVNTDYKYGWIKVNALSRKDIYFISYAIER